jgi:hypothetical protein
MLRATENKGELIIREVPVNQWAFFFALAVVLFLIYFLFSDSYAWYKVLFIAALAISFVFLFLSEPVTTIKIDRGAKFVSVRKRSLLNYSFKVYSFNEIEDSIYVEAKEGDRFGTIYQILMPLKNGEKIELSTSTSLNKDDYFKVVGLINPYIFDTSKQVPSKLSVFDDH